MSGLLSRDLSNQFCLYLVHDALITLICAFVLSRIDYCNSLLAGCPKIWPVSFKKVFKNHAARLISRSARSDHIILCPTLRAPHWIPVESRIQYNFSFFLTFKPLNSQAPSYLSDLLQLYVPSRQLLSYTTLLRLPSAHLKSSGRRAFLFQEPLLWNNLPCSLRHSSFTALSKSAFKTHLFPLDYEFFASVRICVHLCAIGFACVCVCVCVCMRARACVRLCVRVCVCMCGM